MASQNQQPAIYERLQGVLPAAGEMFYTTKLNDDSFTTVPYRCHRNPTVYLTLTGKWQRQPSMGIRNQYSSSGVVDGERDLLFFIKTVDEDNHLHSIKLNPWTPTSQKITMSKYYDVQSMIVVDDKLHVFGYARDYRPFHGAIDLVTWEVADADISGHPWDFEESRVVMYEEAKNRFILDYKGELEYECHYRIHVSHWPKHQSGL